jgi:hypothetical protein
MLSVKRKKTGSSDKQGRVHSTGIPPEAIERAVHELPVYTREELEVKLRALEELITGIRIHANNVIVELGHILNSIRGVIRDFLSRWSLSEEIREKMFELDDFMRGLIKKVVIRALDLDDNFEKWGRIFGVTFDVHYGSPLIGLVVVREESGEHVPVVVRIAYGGGLEFVPVEEYKRK